MPRIPVSIVTGFLGAGKTTFLNRLIATGALDSAALVINEFGDIGIDHLLIETADEGIVELSGGCLCCSLRGDLADTLSRLAARDPAPTRIVVETTGLADPGPIAQMVIANLELNQSLELAGIIALIDCAEGPEQIEVHEEARRQIAMADRLVLTKGDVKKRAAGFEAMLRAINSAAVVVDGVSDELSVDWLDGAFSSPRLSQLQNTADALSATASHPGGSGLKTDISAKSHPHQTRIKAIALSAPNSFPLSAIELFLDNLQTMCGDGLLRVKGLVCTAGTPSQPLLIQGVAQSFDTPRRLPGWPDGDTTTRLVVIGNDLDEPAISRLFGSLTGRPVSDAPDRQALEESPLSVPGFV